MAANECLLCSHCSCSPRYTALRFSLTFNFAHLFLNMVQKFILIHSVAASEVWGHNSEKQEEMQIFVVSV
jgi:hypothetical protein